MSNNNYNEQKRKYYAPFSYKKGNKRGERSPVDNDDIQNIVTNLLVINNYLQLTEKLLFHM